MTLGKGTKSRFLIAALCLLFSILSIKAAPMNCHAFEKEKIHKTGLTWHHASISQDPFVPLCTCGSSEKTCCMSTNTNRPEDLRLSVAYGNSSSRLSVVQGTIIRLLADTILTQNDICLNHCTSFHKSEFFVINCTLLI